MIIFIHGISTSGKTTIGKKLSLILENSIFIDQDTYFLKEKTKVSLSNGEQVSNYDTVESIDWQSFNRDIQIYSKKYKNVIVVGFELIEKLINSSPNISFYLRYNLYKDLTLNVIINNRSITKKINQNCDILNVREVVYPFHESILSQIKVDHILNIYNGLERKSIDILSDEILSFL
jgi:cytidylate kinase